MLAVFAAVIIVLSVALTVFSVKNNRLSENGAQAGEAYESLSEALGSEQSARAQEASSYQAQIDAQNKAHQSEKDAREQTIADLTRQNALKRAATTQPPVKQSPPCRRELQIFREKPFTSRLMTDRRPARRRS